MTFAKRGFDFCVRYFAKSKPFWVLLLSAILQQCVCAVKLTGEQCWVEKKEGFCKQRHPVIKWGSNKVTLKFRPNLAAKYCHLTQCVENTLKIVPHTKTYDHLHHCHHCHSRQGCLLIMTMLRAYEDSGLSGLRKQKQKSTWKTFVHPSRVTLE